MNYKKKYNIKFKNAKKLKLKEVQGLTLKVPSTNREGFTNGNVNFDLSLVGKKIFYETDYI